MDTERHVISKIVQTGDLSLINEHHITAKFFHDKKNRNVFLSIVKHRSEYGSVPSVDALKTDHPNYDFVDPKDNFEYLISELERGHSLVLLEQGVEKAVEAWEKRDPKAGVAAMSKALSEIGREITSTKDSVLSDTGTLRLERYATYKDFDGGIRGIPSGFHSIDRATLGFQNGQLNVFTGPPKAGKSTLLVLSAIAALKHGVRPLFIGFEMSNEEQEERIDSIMAGISHARLRSGTLTKEEWNKLERSVRNIANLPPMVLTSDVSSTLTLSGVAAKIDAVQPGIVFVDGVYMMEDEQGYPANSPQALTNLTRGFKRMARIRDIPINISTQVLSNKMSKTKGITPDAIGYSSSFQQDADNIIGVLSTEDDNIQQLSIVLSRNCPKLTFQVLWDWETGQFEELEGDIFDPGSVYV